MKYWRRQILAMAVAVIVSYLIYRMVLVIIDFAAALP